MIKKNEWSSETELSKEFKDLEKDSDNFLIMNSSILKKNVFHYVSPIYSSSVLWGWIHSSMSLSEYNDRLYSMYLNFCIFFTVLAILSIFISYIFSKSISKPIINLNNIANEISKGNLDLKSDYKNDDEVGKLSQTFNNMIFAINETQTQLKLSHEKLEDRVVQRTKDLDGANKLLEIKTIELEELNKTLDKKIKEEIEKRIQQESILIQQSRLAATGEMIGNIAHQWRQPLSLITTCASGIKLEKEFGISVEENEIDKLNSIIQASNYLSKTIDDFRNFFKPNKEKSYFSIENMTKQAISLVNASFNFYYIKINKNFNPIDTVYGYPNEFSQAILNILANAKDVLIEKEIENPYINIDIYEKDEEVKDMCARGVIYKLVNRIETRPQIDLSFELSNYGVTILFSFEGNVLSKEYLNLSEILYTGLNSAIKNKFKKSNFSYDPYQLAVLNDKFHEEITKLWLYDINFYKLLFNDVEFNRTILRLRFNKLFNADYLITTDGNDVNLALDENVIIFRTTTSGKLEITLNE